MKDLQTKIQTITDGEYAVAKQDVDRLRQELGQAPLPSLQSTLEEKSAECVSISVSHFAMLTFLCSRALHSAPRFVHSLTRTSLLTLHITPRRHQIPQGATITSGGCQQRNGNEASR